VILRGCLVGALGVVTGLALVAGAADIGARHLATGKVEERIRQAVPQASGVHGRIRSWPFLAAGVNGRVSEIDARVDRLSVAPVVYTDLTVALHGARVSIANMVTSLRVDVTRIDRGTVSFTLADSYLDQVDPGVAAAARRVSVDAKRRALVVGGPTGLPVLVALPGPSLVPCVPGAAPGPAGVTLGCSFTTVPAAFTTTG
jgi:hypothetical protein